MDSTDDTWKTPIDIVRGMVDDWDASGELPKAKIGEDGEELLSSKLRRIAFAYAKQKEQTPRPPGYDQTRFRQKRIEDELPAMQEYLRQCERRARQLAGEKILEIAATVETIWAKDVEQYNREQAELFHAETPNALKALGLEDQEINLLGDLGSWPAVEAVKDWLAGDRPFLVVGGDPGTGKTVAAASALLSCKEEMRTTEGRVCLRWTRKGRFTKAAELARMQLFGKEALEEQERLRRVHLLIIDDLGAETMSEPWLSQIQDLIDERMRRRKLTLITTNLKWPEFEKRYGPRIARRLVENGVRFKAVKP